MPDSLYNLVRAKVEDPSTQALSMQAEKEPVAGPFAPVAPPTYKSPIKEEKFTFAFSSAAFIPARDESGWFTSIQRQADGSPRHVGRVVLNSVAAESGRVEQAIINNQDRLNITAPGLFLEGDPVVDSDDSDLATRELSDALTVSFGSWDAAHRHVDANFKYASDAPGKQVWQSNAAGSVKDLITTASPARADLLFSHFPNACIFGFWLSSGTAARHKMARAYSSELIGYGAQPIEAGATKMDPFGGAPKELKVGVKNGSLTVQNSMKGKPSDFGLGLVPGSPVVRGFACELILQQSTLSLPALRSLQFDSEEKKSAALTVLVLLTMAGQLLAQDDGFLRSGCSLVTVDQKWGWRSQSSGRSIAELPIPSLDEVVSALGEALKHADSLGIGFADPITLSYSDAQRSVIEARVKAEREKAVVEDAK